MKRIFLIVLLLVALLPLWAEETILLGNVYDAGSGEPIENASVYFRGSKIGTTTDADGFFYMRLDVRAKVKLTISAVGYKRQQYDIEPGASAGITTFLEEKVMLLEEVAAMPGANPVEELMAEVRAHRRKNSEVASIDRPTTDSRYFISDIQPKHLRKRWTKQLESGLLMQDDSTYLLPLPKDRYSGEIIPLPEHFDFYQSNIPLHTTSFLSPLAASAKSFYRFYLVDSAAVQTTEGREKHYVVHFLPRNTFDPLLQGTLEVDSATYALRKVEASAPRNVNINYLTGLNYYAQYQPNGQLADEHLSALFEVAVKTDTSHLFPSLLAERRALVKLVVPQDTLEHRDAEMTAFLQSAQPKKIVPDVPDSLVLAAQDSLFNQPLFRFARWAAELCYTGYIPTGTRVDIGRITDIIRYTPEEHLHLGIPFRTNQRLFPHVALGGYVGYGFRDHGVKYKAEVEVLLPTERRHYLRISVSDKYAAADVSAFDALKCENSISGENLRFTTFLLSGLQYNSQTARCLAARKREVQVQSENDWCASEGQKPSVETSLSVQMGHQGYGNPLLCDYYSQASYRYASIRGLLRLGWHERKADFFTVRKRLYSKYPTLYAGGELGSFTMPGEQHYHVYGKLQLMLRQDVSLGVGGSLFWLCEGGLVLGRVPYPLLGIMNGNQGYTFQPERFTLMNFGQYAADRYLLGHVCYDGRGVLFGRIPGVRYLRLHELVEAKVAWGSLSARNAAFAEELGLPDLQSLHVPYTEVGVGIGNILRIGDVWSVWRLTHRDDPSAARWAIRFRLHLSL